VDCRGVQAALSARMDGERLAPRVAAAVERHLAGCPACAAFDRAAWRLREMARFQVAPAVPDLVGPIMAAVRAEARAPVLEPRTARRAERPRPPRAPGARPARVRRLAAVAAALAFGLVAGSLVVGGPWQRSARVDAAEVTRSVAAAATALSSYEARFEITERDLAPEVPVRHLSMDVWFRAPERFRLDVVDHTAYPSRDWTPTDLELVVNGSRWYSVAPSACPVGPCPPRVSRIRNRLPFSWSVPAPTDVVVPVATFADDARVSVVGRGTVLGRPAVEVRMPFERARALFPFLSLGGTWRPFFPDDRVDLWLDASSWSPLRYSVFPAPTRAREAWALRFGLPRESPSRPILEVEATFVSRRPPASGVFRIPPGPGGRDQGARSVPLADVPAVAGFEPVTPAVLEGLRLYRVVVQRGAAPPAQAVITYARGLSYLKIAEAPGRRGDAPLGPVGPQAQEVRLANGGLAYYEPATPEHGRRLSIHTGGSELYLETNLPRSALLRVAGSLPVAGAGIPQSWRVHASADGVTERVSLARAAATVSFPIALPSRLPAGYAFASAEIVRIGTSTAVNLYFQQRDADYGGGPIRLHIEPGTSLPPASSARQAQLEVDGSPGRWTPDRRQLEWVRDGLYYSLDADGLDLGALLAVARSLRPYPEPSGDLP